MAFLKLDQIEPKEIVPGGVARFVHSDNMTFAHWIFKAGAEFPEHSHPHEQVVNMLEGEFELIIDGAAKRLSPGDVAIVEPNALHAGTSLTDCRIIDVFYPVREDYQ